MSSSSDSWVFSPELDGFDWDSFELPDIPDEQSVVTQVTKKRIRDRSYAIPRLLKRDLRRQYGFMFANVINSSDRSLIEEFFDNFATNGLSLNKQNSSPQEFFSLQMQGAKTISRYWSLLLDFTPDHVFRLLDVQVITRKKEQSCRLVAKYTVQGTNIQSITPKEVAHRILTGNEMKSLVALPRDPRRFSFSGQLVFHIGDDKRIQKLDIDAQ